MRIVLSDTQWTPEKIKAMKNKSGETLDMLYSFWFDRDNFLNGKYSKTMKNVSENKQEGSKFYIDSGVFSANKSKTFVPVEELISYCKKYEGIYDYVFNMDYGDRETQLNNCKKMKSEKLPVIGVWKWESMPFDYFERFLEYTDYMSIGSVAYNSNKYNIIQSLFEYLYKKNLYKVKIHILGTESFKLLSELPVYSADSSKIVIATIYGFNTFFDKKELEINRLHPRREPLKTIKHFHEIEKYIEMGLINQLKDKSDEKIITKTNLQARINRAITAIEQRFIFQKLLTNIWKERGVVWDE